MNKRLIRLYIRNCEAIINSIVRLLEMGKATNEHMTLLENTHILMERKKSLLV